MSPWAAGAVPAVPHPHGHRGSSQGSSSCALLLVPFPQQASPVPPKTPSSPGRASQQTPAERALVGNLALCGGGRLGLGFLHFCCHSLGLGSSRVAQAGAEHGWHRAGHAASPASREFGSQGQELSYVLHVPGICPPAPAGPRGAHPALLPLSSAKQGKHSRRNAAFGVKGLEQPGGNLEWGCYRHKIYVREQEQENPACPTSEPGGATQPWPAHRVPVPEQRLLKDLGFSHCPQSKISLR